MPTRTKPSRNHRALARRSVLALVLLAPAWLFGSAHCHEAWADLPPAEPFLVIVHVKNPATALTRDYLADAFLKKISQWDNHATMRPVDQRANSATRRVFTTAVLNRSIAAVRNYWQQRIFSGREVPPPELESDEAVMHYVAANPGAVGYVSARAELVGVKAVTIR